MGVKVIARFWWSDWRIELGRLLSVTLSGLFWGVMVKSVIEAIGLLFGFVALRLGAMVWWLLKVFFGFCVIVGAAVQILEGFDLAQYEQMTWYVGVWDGIVSLGRSVVSNWMAVAVLMVFLWVIGIKRRAEQVERDVTHTKIGLVALLNYLEIEVETEGMKQIKEVGGWSTTKTGWTNRVLGFVLGGSVRDAADDTLTSKAVRHGGEVNLRMDMAHYAKLDTSSSL